MNNHDEISLKQNEDHDQHWVTEFIKYRSLNNEMLKTYQTTVKAFPGKDSRGWVVGMKQYLYPGVGVVHQQFNLSGGGYILITITLVGVFLS